jgi:pimeloyl-ACP methyl ester carboxylesterase
MQKLTSRDGTTIAFDRVGQGEPVIIVEGAFCDRGTSAPLAAALASRFTVFSYDRRGRGDSGDTLPWSVEREVEDLEALIAEAGGSAFVYGMSSGAALGMEAAARGVAVRKLALYEPPLSPDGNRERSGDLVGTLSRLVAAGRRADAVSHFMTKAVAIPEEVVGQIRNSPMWAGLEAIAHTLVYDNTITGDGTLLTKRAGMVRVPTLVVNGGDCPEFLQASARAVTAAVPGARQRVLAGQTHEVDVEILAPVLVEFFGGETWLS